MIVGFSTGSLALGNARLGLQMVAGQATAAIELSALREDELLPLIEMLDSLDLRQYSYVSFHAPSRLVKLSEHEVISALTEVARRGWPIIVHPDVISTAGAWGALGNRLCLENMDKRKCTGRTASELAMLFERLPQATLCFDIGHARQIDPTMGEADAILRQFRNRLQQVHLSVVNSESVHRPLNAEAMFAFRRVAHWLPDNVPIILETPVRTEDITAELQKVSWLRLNENK
jgi:hypothetical protein